MLTRIWNYWNSHIILMKMQTNTKPSQIIPENKRGKGNSLVRSVLTRCQKRHHRKTTDQYPAGT